MTLLAAQEILELEPRIKSHILQIAAQLEAVTRERDAALSLIGEAKAAAKLHPLDTPVADLSKLDAHDKATGEK